MNNWGKQHILITRPTRQAQGLTALLNEKGASVLPFPTLVIQPVTDAAQLTDALQNHLNANWYIFISPNAVEHALPLLKSKGWLSHMKGQFAAVGAGTRDALAGFGVHNVIYPFTGVGALALLDALKHEDFTDQTVVIFKGDSTNQTLEEGLVAKGALIHPVVCYQRQRTQNDPAPLLHALENGQIDLIVTTSGDGLQSLIDLLPVSYQTKLYELPVLVISQRIKSLAESLGFSSILLAKDASDEAIVSTIDHWQDQGALHD